MASVDNKRILKNTVALYLRMLLVMGVSLYTSRVVLNQLGVADYGVYNVVGGVVVMLSFFNGSMATATNRFLANAIGKRDTELELTVFTMSWFIHLIVAGILLLLAETLGLWFVKTYLVFPPDTLNAAIWVYHFSVMTTVIGILTVPFTAIVTAKERMGVYAYISILDVCLKLAVAFSLMAINADKLKLYGVLVFVAGLVTSVTWAIYSFRTFPTCRIRRVWSRQLFSEMLGFVGWQTLGQCSLLLRTQGVNMLLNIFFGPLLNAARGIAVQVNNAVQNFALNSQTASIPQINKLYAAGQLESMRKLIYRSSKMTFLLMFIISMPILAETEPILRVWLKIVPEYGVLFVRLMLITALTSFLSGTLVFGAMATGRLKEYQLYMVSLYIFDIVFVYGFFKLGFAAYTFFLVEIAFHIVGLLLRLRILSKMVGVQPMLYLREVVGRELLAVVVVMSAVGVMVYLLPCTPLYTIMNMIVALLSAVFCSYAVGLDRIEREWAKSTVIEGFSKIFHKK